MSAHTRRPTAQRGAAHKGRLGARPLRIRYGEIVAAAVTRTCLGS
eukprot:COSAG01_NODE_3126_length_6545_cov_7.559572_7_plen_45_part_00